MSANGKRTAFPAGAKCSDGLTKTEYACIHLRIPETGDPALDAIIAKAQRQRFAGLALIGNLANSDPQMRPSSSKQAAAWSVDAADELLAALAKPAESEVQP